MQRGSGAARQTGKWPVTFDGSRAGQNLGSPTAYYDAAYPQTVTLVDGAISQLNDFNGNGNNATQSTAANRPVLSRADNLENRVIDSELANWLVVNNWATNRAVTTATTISKGGKTLKFFREDTTATATHLVAQGSLGQILNTVSGQTYIVRFLAYSTNRRLAVSGVTGFAANQTVFNLMTGSVDSVGANATLATMTPTGDGAYYCQVTLTANASNLSAWLQWNLDDGTTTSYTGDGASGAYITDASFRRTGTDLLITATTTFPQYAGINGNAVPVFDGSNDSLTTAIAVNPTGGMWGAAVVGVNSFATTSAIFSVRNLAATDRINWWITAGGAMELAVCSDSYSVTKIARTAPAGTIVANTPCILSFTYDGGTSSTGIKIYKNGVQVDTGNNNSGVYAVPTAGGNLSIGQSNTNNYFSGYLSPAIFGQGSQWSDANRQAWEQYLLQRFIPNYVWFSPDANVTSVDGAVASWTDTTNVYVASQSTAANRPILSRTDNRENLAYPSGSVATWTNNNQIVILSSTEFRENTATSSHYIGESFLTNTAKAGTTYTYSVDIKRGTGTRNASFWAYAGGGLRAQCLIDLDTGVITDTTGGTLSWQTLPSISVSTDDPTYYKVTGAVTSTTTGNLNISVYLVDGTTLSYTGDGASSLRIARPSARRVGTDLLTTATTTTPQYAGLNNNQPAFVFDGSNDFLSCAELSTLLSGSDVPMSLVTVFRLPETTSTKNLICISASASSSTYFIIEAAAAIVSIKRRDGVAAEVARSSASMLSANINYTLSVVFTGTTVSAWVNGVNVINAGAMDVGSCSFNQARIGQQLLAASASNYMNGYLADMVIAPRTMSDAERQSYEQRFMQKYNIS